MSVCVLNCLKSQDNSLSVHSFCWRLDRSRTVQCLLQSACQSHTGMCVCVCVYALCFFSRKKQGLVLPLDHKPRVYTLTNTARRTKRRHGLCSDPQQTSARLPAHCAEREEGTSSRQNRSIRNTVQHDQRSPRVLSALTDTSCICC